jgi:activator of HSP90 ATPase
MNAEIGTEFSLWGGDIYGKNVEVVSEKKLVQEWFAGDWAKPSIVTFTLKTEGNKTVVELEHADVPDDEFEDIDQGWNDYYLGPMKEFLEKGIGLKK